MSNLSVEQQFFVDKKRKSPFLLIFILVGGLFTFIGVYFSIVGELPPNIQKVVRKIETSFIIEEPIKEPEPVAEVVKPEPKPEPEVVEEVVDPDKVYDLTEDVQLDAIEDVVVEEVQEQPERVVYGVNKVFSQGLGSGGSMSSAVVGKLGNSVNVAFDTVTANDEDLVGQLVSAVTVTSSPEMKRRVKAVISEEIRASGVTGEVEVKVLVDTDGGVKRAVAQNDLGFGTKEAALTAALQCIFSPAIREEIPVAVWIVIRIRFEKIS